MTIEMKYIMKFIISEKAFKGELDRMTGKILLVKQNRDFEIQEMNICMHIYSYIPKPHMLKLARAILTTRVDVACMAIEC